MLPMLVLLLNVGIPVLEVIMSDAGKTELGVVVVMLSVGKTVLKLVFAGNVIFSPPCFGDS